MGVVQDASGLVVGTVGDTGNNAPRIIDFRHAAYSRMGLFWQKWRFVYAGGDDFSEMFLEKYSDREDLTAFNMRRRITPSPSFAKAAVNEIKNSIFQKMNDIVRTGGSTAYQEAVAGLNNGVDNHGATMNSFIGRYVLPELLTMAKVGIFVDMPDNVGDTLLESAGKKPYLYMYRAEQMLSWTYRTDRADEFQSVLLVDYVDDTETISALPIGVWSRYRHIWLEPTDGKVHVQYFNEDSDYIDRDGRPGYGEYILDIDYIPLVVLELSDSLLRDSANHQIALLNLESSDIMYALKSNFPFYTEQRDSTIVSDYLKKSRPVGDDTPGGQSAPHEIEVGSMQGRTYDFKMERPGFIHPSSEPLMASMAKQQQLKNDIRLLVNLSLSNVQAVGAAKGGGASGHNASAASKQIDHQSLECGLAYIGLELEHGERKLARYWAMFEGSDPATIMYPAKYALQSEEDKRAAVQNLEKIRDSVFSPTFRKQISKQIARLLLDGQVDMATMEIINQEIDSGVAIVADPQLTLNACEQGICSLDVAEKIFGYPKGTADKAATDHVERLARIAHAQGLMSAQTGKRGDQVVVDPNADARGVGDLSGKQGNTGKAEKKGLNDQTLNPTPTDPTRGPGK